MDNTLIPSNPEFREFVRHQFKSAAFIQHLGIDLVNFGPGWCETIIPLCPEHLQQDNFAHAGVVTTLADHTCGMAAGTVCPAGRKVLTIEFKVNFLRPGVGESLRCRAEVVKPGKNITVVEARVHAGEKLIALMTATMALAE